MSEVEDNAAFKRFELHLNGDVALAYYKKTPSVITFTHTEVPQQFAGKGVGSRLARGALEAARAEGLKVVAQCPFIKSFIAKNPEFADLLQEPHG
jgi:predicted GNAT family acetyltransferase